MSELKEKLLNQDYKGISESPEKKDISLSSQNQTPQHNENQDQVQISSQGQQNQNEKVELPQRAESQQLPTDESAIVNKLNKLFANVEKNPKGGLILALFFSVGVGLLISASKFFTPELTSIEVTFIVYLTAFLFNYSLIRNGNILPYIENEDLNYQAKICGVSILASIVLFLFSLTILEKNTGIFFFFLNWVICYLLDKFQNQSNMNKEELILSAASTLGILLILSPSFSTAPGKEEQQLQGFLANLGSTVCFCISFYKMKQMNREVSFTINHIICLIVVLFVPIFFPIEGIKSPKLVEWIIIIVFGLIFSILSLLLIKSIQISKLPKIGVILQTVIISGAVFDILYQNQSFTPMIFIGLAIGGASQVFLYKKDHTVLLLEDNNVNMEELQVMSQ